MLLICGFLSARCVQEGAGGAEAPPAVSESLLLELEFDSEASVERTLVRRVGVTRYARRPDSTWLQEVDVGITHGDLSALIDTQKRALVGQVEQVGRQADLGPFGQPD